jgi:signal transduction histidine kinase/uncharacterized membrane protein
MSAKDQSVSISEDLKSSLAFPYAASTEPSKAKSAVSLDFLRKTVWSVWNSVTGVLDNATDRFIPVVCINDPEAVRRARLICRFSHLGAIFGALYALFYLSIGHHYGALAIIICSLGFEVTPWLMKKTASMNSAGNMLLLILVAGFTTLCCLEGGLEGHAIAWLASVPLCALILLGRRSAGRWVLVSFGACACIAALNLAGIKMPTTYDAKWEGLVSSAGYLGFILFMFLLGVIFETSRERAFNKMQEAIGKLQVSNVQLVKLNEEKNAFLGIAAHDLKNPLGVVIGTAELMRSCKDEALITKLSGNIVGAGTRMLRLVKDLLDANAIEEGRFTSNLERCNLRVLIRECVDNNTLAGTNKGIQLQLEHGNACWVRTDKNATLQVLDNLISNAVKYSPRNTTVHISTAAGDDFGSISIRDEGPGLDADDLKKMFGKFTRLSARPTGGESSNGLGLSIVKRLAEAMGGTVSCESQLGHGATFTLRVPVWKEIANP